MIKSIKGLQDHISIDFIKPGQFFNAADGYLHCKYAPCTIIALATDGRYEVQTPHSHVVAADGEAFLATEGQWLEITHHAATPGGRMQAIWVHARFSLFRTVDIISLLTLPPKTDRGLGLRFAAIIRELLQLTTAGVGVADTAGSAAQSMESAATDFSATPVPGLHLTAPTNPLNLLARRQALGYQVLELLCSQAPLSAAGEAFLAQADRLAPVLAYIRSHIKRALTIGELAAAAGLSRSQFHRYFQEQMGKTPMEYVKQQRLNAARLLLLATRQTVYAIAEETGFLNPFHFSREFKRLFGQPPLEYRRTHAGLQV